MTFFQEMLPWLIWWPVRLVVCLVGLLGVVLAWEGAVLVIIHRLESKAQGDTLRMYNGWTWLQWAAAVVGVLGYVVMIVLSLVYGPAVHLWWDQP